MKIPEFINKFLDVEHNTRMGPKRLMKYWIVGREFYDDYYESLEKVQRFMDDKINKIGYNNLLFNSVPVVWALDTKEVIGLDENFSVAFYCNDWKDSFF